MLFLLASTHDAMGLTVERIAAPMDKGIRMFCDHAAKRALPRMRVPSLMIFSSRALSGAYTSVAGGGTGTSHPRCTCKRATRVARCEGDLVHVRKCYQEHEVGGGLRARAKGARGV